MRAGGFSRRRRHQTVSKTIDGTHTWGLQCIKWSGSENTFICDVARSLKPRSEVALFLSAHFPLSELRGAWRVKKKSENGGCHVAEMVDRNFQVMGETRGIIGRSRYGRGHGGRREKTEKERIEYLNFGWNATNQEKNWKTCTRGSI